MFNLFPPALHASSPVPSPFYREMDNLGKSLPVQQCLGFLSLSVTKSGTSPWQLHLRGCKEWGGQCGQSQRLLKSRVWLGVTNYAWKYEHELSLFFFYRVTRSHQNSWFWRERLKGATSAFHLAFWSDLAMQRKWFSSVDNIWQTCKFEHAVWVMQAKFSLFVQMKLFLTKAQVAAVRLKATPTRCQETKYRTLRTLSSST